MSINFSQRSGDGCGRERARRKSCLVEKRCFFDGPHQMSITHALSSFSSLPKLSDSTRNTLFFRAFRNNFPAGYQCGNRRVQTDRQTDNIFHDMPLYRLMHVHLHSHIFFLSSQSFFKHSFLFSMYDESLPQVCIFLRLKSSISAIISSVFSWYGCERKGYSCLTWE